MEWLRKSLRALTSGESLWSLGYLVTGSSFFIWLWDNAVALGWPVVVLLGVGSAATLMLSVCGSLALWRYFRPLDSLQNPAAIDAPPEPSPTPISSPASERDDEALGALMVFTVDHVLPTIADLEYLQKQIIRAHQGSEIVGDFAIMSVLHNWRNKDIESLREAYERLSLIGGSPLPDYSFEEMQNFILAVDNNYGTFVSQLVFIMNKLGIDYRQEHQFSELWSKWRKRHDAMADAYDAIRRDKKFKKLFRPGLPNRLREGLG